MDKELETVVNEVKLIESIKNYNLERAKKTFSNRHPELGKMISCKMCNHRHRANITCTAKYSKLAPGLGRPKGRYHPHPNKRSLLLIERTRQLFDKYSPYLEPANAMKAARAEASRTLQAERKAARKRKSR